MNIAKAIKDAREAAWLTQEELAAKTILTTIKIQLLEEEAIDYEELSRSELHSIAEALYIPLELLIILGIEDQDIDPKKKEIAAILLPSLQEIVKELIKDKER